MALGVGREAAAVLAAQAGRADLLARVGFTLIMPLATTFWVLLFRRVLAQRKAAEYQAGEQRRADWRLRDPAGGWLPVEGVAVDLVDERRSARSC